MTVAAASLFNPTNDPETMRTTAGYIVATVAGLRALEYRSIASQRRPNPYQPNTDESAARIGTAERVP